MDDVAEFLLARIAEDEAASAPGPEPESWCDRADGLHFDHARVVAECEAKRRIVELRCDKWVTTGGSSLPFASHYQNGDGVLRALALPYADHPDYREEEWKV